LIGPDGSGKTTVGRRLEEVLPMPGKYIYMGVNWEASNHLLPTTRLVDRMMRSLRSRRATGGPEVPPGRGGPAVPQVRVRPVSPARRLYRAARVQLSLANLVAEEWYRQIVSWTYLRRGVVVIFDRHFFFDYYTDHVAGGSARTLRRRVHGFLLSRVYPKPDLVVYLDAPPELLFARKGEGTPEWLAQRRRDYLELAPSIKDFVVVDASRPIHEVTHEVAEVIRSFSVSRSLTRQPATYEHEQG
jgi:thymidylate kinase